MRKSVPALLEKTGLISETVRVVSAPTARTNLKYDVLDFRPGRLASHPGSMYDILQERFEEAKATLETEERILIFCSDYKECDTIANLLSLPCYKAKDDNATPEEWSLTKAKIQDEWFLGNPPSLVATTAFSLGIDHPHVRFAFVVNAYDLMSVVQMTGRAGRTRGSRGTCVILADNAPCPIDDQIDHRGRRLLIDLYNNTNCARITLGSFDDRAYSCYAMPDAEICSYCARLTPDSPIVPVPLPIKPLDYHPSLSANNAAPASQPNDYSLPRRHLPDEIANHSASHPPEISSVAPSRDAPAPLPSPTSTHTRRGVFARPSREAPAPPLRFPSAPSPIHADTQRRPSHHISSEVSSDVFYAREAAPNRSPAALSIPVAGPSSLFPPTTTERVKKAFDYLLNLKARACLPCTVMLRVDKGGKQCGHILRCATGLFLQGSETGALWKTEFQTHLRYPADRRICFRCSFPSLVFPHQPKDKECSSYDDIVKVVAFSIYNLKNLEETGPRLQSRLLERMAERDGQIWASITKFRKWAELPSASGFVNIHELVAAWSEMQEERQWSA
ncbi:hypothetical protein ONZ45_g10814 [Pleurotus djamor]|nr:hypothetical protein ONZ45_g10814 [Pleurotus djamor]